MEIQKKKFNTIINYKKIDDLINYVDDFYIQSYQTQIHIKNMIRYTNFFIKIINKTLINYYKNINSKENKKFLIFFIKTYYPQILKNISIKKLLSNEKIFKDFLNQIGNQIILGSFLHDIGKNFIDIKLLDNEKKYNDDDIKEMKKHIEYGIDFFNILSLDYNNDFSIIKNIIKEHHIKNNNMKSESKIIQIIDIFEALANIRTYKPGLTFNQIKNRIF